MKAFNSHAFVKNYVRNTNGKFILTTKRHGAVGSLRSALVIFHQTPESRIPIFGVGVKSMWVSAKILRVDDVSVSKLLVFYLTT